MKRSLACAVAFIACLLLSPSWTQTSGEMTKKEQFALELRACKRAFASGTPSKCELYGKIEVVDHFEDVKVEKVEHHEDLKVSWVDNFSDEPGKWEKVEHHEDYKVKFVDHHEDLKVKFVDHFAGSSCD